PFARLRFREYKTARLLDDTVDRRQPQSGPFAHLFGSEKRLPNLAEHISGNARAGVGELESSVIRNRQDIGSELGNLIGLHRIGLDGKRPPALRGHGVSGIDSEIDDDLLELARVGT